MKIEKGTYAYVSTIQKPQNMLHARAQKSIVIVKKNVSDPEPQPEIVQTSRQSVNDRKATVSTRREQE